MLNGVYFLELAAYIIAVSLCCLVAVASSYLAVDYWRTRRARRAGGPERRGWRGLARAAGNFWE